MNDSMALRIKQCSSSRKANDLCTQLLHYVRNGNSAYIKKIFSNLDHSGLMRFLMGDDTQFAHNVFQFLEPQIARAAIEGGVSEIAAAAVYFDHRKKAERVNSGQEMQNLLYDSYIEYANMVASVQTKKLPILAHRCRDYIREHLYEPIAVSQIAQKLNVSRSYLSHAYKTACGETILERIHKAKIAAAEVLLEYSRLSLADIAAQLGFASQSHFTQIFCKQSGITPRQYRESKKANI
jgi:AraC-like DNA-binding protein